ncbi:MAG: HAD family hydrolase [Bifidobacteriaceae bacterium]|nr:HAD family hydrolase [Bifidobacteriaceae bacterium]
MVNPHYGVVFDLDDTLYLERDYVASGFRHVAARVASGRDASAIYRYLWEGFRGGLRGGHFDRLLDQYPSIADQWTVPELVSIYRCHCPKITLRTGIAETLSKLRSAGVGLGVISDGAYWSQVQKARVLRLDALVDELVFTDSWGKEYWKPHARAFALMERRFALAPSKLVYVGDNPAKDFSGPHARGWASIRLRTPGQLHECVAATEPAPTWEVPSIESLSDLLMHIIREP